MEPESLITKIINFICCRNGCPRCCDCFKKRITKDEIKYKIYESTPDSRRPSQMIQRQDSELDPTRRSSSTASLTSIDSIRKNNNTPIIDMKPIEFWTANKESVQPKPGSRRFDLQQHVHQFQPHLYELNENEPLTDEEKMARYEMGQIHFSLQYEIPTKRLLVKIIEARDLLPPVTLDESKTDLAHSNPYVTSCLLPDQKNSQQTTVKKKTQDPIYEEIFAFEISYKEVQRRTLELTIIDFDRYSRHCVIGQVLLPLANVNLIKGRHMWKPLQPSSKEKPELGEILLSLNYLPSAGRLNVDVIKAKQLLQTNIISGADPFVKLTMAHFEKPIKTKKTTCKKNILDPVFNESLNFNVAPTDLEDVSLVVSVWNHNTTNRDDFVGRIVLGKYASGPHENTHWSRLLGSHRSPIAQWHTLRTREECDQVSVASLSVP